MTILTPALYNKPASVYTSLTPVAMLSRKSRYAGLVLYAFTHN